MPKQFSDSPSMARSENGGHPWPPPLRGLRLLVATAGPGKSKAWPSAPARARSWLPGPLAFDLLEASRATRIRTPGGRPAWMPAVFGSSHGWRVRKFLRRPQSLSDVDPLGAFFGYFLCTSKESNSPSGESPSDAQLARRLKQASPFTSTEIC